MASRHHPPGTVSRGCTITRVIENEVFIIPESVAESYESNNIMNESYYICLNVCCLNFRSSSDSIFVRSVASGLLSTAGRER